jgi:hypothetical protein
MRDLRSEIPSGFSLTLRELSVSSKRWVSKSNCCCSERKDSDWDCLFLCVGGQFTAV